MKKPKHVLVQMVPVSTSFCWKPECYKCGYWDKKHRRYYKCYAGNCPAKARDKKGA